ncbi:MAG: hypothetical protein R3E13_06790 [Alphaproteobacteria bacterium]
MDKRSDLKNLDKIKESLMKKFCSQVRGKAAKNIDTSAEISNADYRDITQAYLNIVQAESLLLENLDSK